MREITIIFLDTYLGGTNILEFLWKIFWISKFIQKHDMTNNTKMGGNHCFLNFLLSIYFLQATLKLKRIIISSLFTQNWHSRVVQRKSDLIFNRNKNLGVQLTLLRFFNYGRGLNLLSSWMADTFTPEREGTLGCLLHQSPKFYINIFLFVGLTTLGTIMNFDWFVHC